MFQFVNKSLVEKLSLLLFILLAALIGIFAAKNSIEMSLLLGMILLIPVFLIRPLLGLMISVPLALWFSYVDLLWVPPRNYVIFLLGFIAILILFHRKKLYVSRYSWQILVVMSVFILWSALISLINGVSPGQVVYTSGRLLSVLLIGFCTMFFIKNIRQLKIFL